MASNQASSNPASAGAPANNPNNEMLGDEICLDSMDNEDIQMLSANSGPGAFGPGAMGTGDRLLHCDYYRGTIFNSLMRFFIKISYVTDFPDYLDDDDS